MSDTIIKIPYTTSPHMEIYNGTLVTLSSESTITEKKKEIEFHNNISTGSNHNLWFQSDVACYHKLVYKLSHLLKVNPTYSIVDLGLQINEDIAILHHGKLEACFFAFPSGWNPGDKQGKTLQELHQPVGDGEVLQKMSNKLAQLMSSKYNYSRWVWTISSTSNKSNHPVYPLNQPTGLEDLWWRTEYQTTTPIQSNSSSAFFVQVSTIKFNTLPRYTQLRIRDSINTMSDNVLTYKNLHIVKTILNDCLLDPLLKTML